MPELHRIGHGAEQSIFCLAAVKARVLHNNGHTRFYDAGIISIQRDRLRILKIIETHMPGTPGRHNHEVWPDGIAVAEENRKLYFCILRSRV